MLEISVERHDDYVLCRPAGELDAYTVAQFREALTELAEESYVLVDLSDVPFMDSAGLGALIGGIRRARENDGDVAVACNRPALTRLLHTTGFDRIVPVRETVEEATGLHHIDRRRVDLVLFVSVSRRCGGTQPAQQGSQ